MISLGEFKAKYESKMEIPKVNLAWEWEWCSTHSFDTSFNLSREDKKTALCLLLAFLIPRGTQINLEWDVN